MIRNDRIQRSLDAIRYRTGVSLSFGGETTRSHGLALRHFSGQTAGALPGIELAYDVGLGGRTVAQRRPLVLNDYVESDTISHQYDKVIQAEQLRAIASAPVVIGRETLLVLYVAYRNDNRIADRILSTLMDEARALEHDLLTSVHLGVDKDLTAARALRARTRRAHAELCELSSAVDDRMLRNTLRSIAENLSGTTVEPASGHVTLTVRETDVLTLVATGLTNREIAGRLGLTLLTVKAYMKAIMAKLNARSRTAAVAEAQAQGLLP
nr:LuxR C-terminal-related transcriptional regulator [Brevibacterium renqingii]